MVLPLVCVHAWETSNRQKQTRNNLIVINVSKEIAKKEIEWVFVSMRLEKVYLVRG